MDTHTQEEDLLTCSICLETLKEPKMLSCLHRFCESCLNYHITSSTARTSSSQLWFSCPDCRQTIWAPNFTAPPSDWAAQFKTDFHTKQLIELRKYRQEPQKSNESRVSHPCPEHGRVEVDLYCVGCSKCACHICAATTHQKCRRLVTLKKAAQDRRSRMQKQISRVEPIMQEALERKKVQEMCMSEVEKKVELARREIRDSNRRVHELVNNQRQRLITELDRNREDLQRNVSANVSVLSEGINNLQCLVKRAQLNMTFSSDVDLLVDRKFNDDIDSCCDKGASISQQYKSLSEKLAHVKCTFEANRSPCASIGDIVFLSDINGSNDSTPSSSQASTSTESGLPRKRTASANHVQCSQCLRVGKMCIDCCLHVFKKNKS